MCVHLPSGPFLSGFVPKIFVGISKLPRRTFPVLITPVNGKVKVVPVL
jgi:hypothetical protein